MTPVKQGKEDRGGGVNLEAAEVGLELASEDLQRSGFADAVGAHKPKHLPGPGRWQPAHKPLHHITHTLYIMISTLGEHT